MNRENPFIIQNYDFSKRQKLCLDFTEFQNSDVILFSTEIVIPSESDGFIASESYEFINEEDLYQEVSVLYMQDPLRMAFIFTRVNNDLYIVTNDYMNPMADFHSNNVEIIYELLDTQMVSTLYKPIQG